MAPRDELLAGLVQDLVGPQSGPDEIIRPFPGDQYITGILYPFLDDAVAEDDEDEDVADDAGDSPGEAIPMSAMRRPNMMGISFAASGAKVSVRVSGSVARYLPLEASESGAQNEAATAQETAGWKRVPVPLDDEFAVTDQLQKHPRDDGLVWWVRGLVTGESESGEPAWQVTVVLTNDNRPAPGRFEAEKATFFQAGFSVRAAPPAMLVPRRAVARGTDEDSLSNAVLYRDSEEWAVGHMCSAAWGKDEGGPYVETSWIPCDIVHAMDPDGHVYFREESKKRTGSDHGAFDAEVLAQAGDADVLADALEAIPAAYERWLERQEGHCAELQAAGKLSPDLAAQTAEHIRIGKDDVLRRLRSGIQAIRQDPQVRLAFTLAQEAMSIQRRWSDPRNPRLFWRPFQLAFQLLTLGAIAEPGSDKLPTPERMTMDLLWFPTGGGKTEAYLGLTAFTLFLRRMRAAGSGEGVAVIMRYTLRLLTVQQFERAARLVMACDHMRRTRSDGIALFGEVPFTIGLWVGSAATANTLVDAETAEEQQRARQLARCPACGTDGSLQWTIEKSAFDVRCEHVGCEVEGVSLGIFTIDEVIYARRPDLLIGTIDKFAQIARNKDTASLFAGRPPELIIQDELHLISGPLGTVAGVYEAAIDLICTHEGIPPKVIGSTATIRRARDQVRQLFNREVLQFPLPILDVADSCFAVVDAGAPGRMYAGVTTSGRSPKFILQAVCASLMQRVHELDVTEKERDPYWTLVAYFNSLRELGGALVMMQDDVHDSVRNFAALHGATTTERPLQDLPLELTSRVDQAEIPGCLVQLEKSYPEQPIDSVLATNMISVGVDIPRLGLMVVNGQPKGMAEYIQATSRVGRGQVPGLVVTVYNAGRPRDRSHYEAFSTWHQTLYREVEATSVTPFAPRARDRALHAAVVALARHRIKGMLKSPQLTPEGRRELEHLVDDLAARARNVDVGEDAGVQRDARLFLDRWEARQGLKSYWNDFRPAESLLVSLETVAAAKAISGEWRHEAVGTPNSMRNVEPETKFQMWEAPMRREAGGTPDA